MVGKSQVCLRNYCTDKILLSLFYFSEHRSSVTVVYPSGFVEQLKARSSATAQKLCISCACLSRLANWSCNAQNTTESQMLYN